MLRYLLVFILSFSTLVEIFDISIDLNSPDQVEIYDVDEGEKNPESEKKKDSQDKDRDLNFAVVVIDTNNKLDYGFNHHSIRPNKIYISEPTPPPEL